jgi:mono/diheme cytochrome c family protein
MRSIGLVVGLASATLAGVLAITTPAAVAQQAVDQALLQQGEQLYNDNCVMCHQAGGVGAPPDFPALTGNDHLTDLTLIVGNIHQGKGSMPPFPDLTADQIAALATYVRNAWANEFGGVTSDQVTDILASLAPTTGPQASVWDGVYTTAQADRGKTLYSGACAACHGIRLNGAGMPDMPPAPAVARSGFIFKWKGKTVASLFDYVRSQMPADNPGTLTDQEYIDVISYMFATSNMPAGDTELPADPKALANIGIEQQPKTK